MPWWQAGLPHKEVQAVSIESRRRAIMAQNGGENTLRGEFGTAFIERVTIPSNSATSANSVINLLRGLRTDSSTYLVACRRVNSESPVPAENEFGSILVYLANNAKLSLRFERYSNGAWESLTTISTIDAVATEGSIFEMVEITPNNIA